MDLPANLPELRPELKLLSESQNRNGETVWLIAGPPAYHEPFGDQNENNVHPPEHV